jgi:hypothetical protein
MHAAERVDKAPAMFVPQARRWQPYTVHGPDAEDRRSVEVRDGDRYVSIDDVADGLVVAEVSSWPVLDREGRLHWDTDPRELVTPLPRMQDDVTAARERWGIIAPDRPLRVGDVFLVRGLTRRHRHLTRVELVLDVSAAAREAAKAALYGAVASTLDDTQARRMRVTEEYAEPDPREGLLDVRQDAPHPSGTEPPP